MYPKSGTQILISDAFNFKVIICELKIIKETLDCVLIRKRQQHKCNKKKTLWTIKLFKEKIIYY